MAEELRLIDTCWLIAPVHEGQDLSYRLPVPGRLLGIVQLHAHRSQPIRTPEAIQDTVPQRMPFRQIRMLEILAWIMSHSNLLHHAPRSDVERTSVGNQGVQPQGAECETHQLTYTFCCESMPPLIG